MTEPTNLDERLARLAARKSGAAQASAAVDATTTSPQTAGVGAKARSRRKHPAAAGRILSVGLSSSAFLSIVAAFGSQTASGATTSNYAAGPPATLAPRVVVQDVHHKMYVDQYGHVLVPVTTAGSTTPGASTAPGATTSGGVTFVPAPSGGGGGSSSGGGGGSSTPVTSPPSGGGGGGGSPVTSPPVTSPPVTSPPVTSPPVTSPPVTSPPTTAPKCSGSKCP